MSDVKMHHLAKTFIGFIYFNNRNKTKGIPHNRFKKKKKSHSKLIWWQQS